MVSTARINQYWKVLQTADTEMFSSRMIGLPTGVIGFILAKRQVDKNRLKQLKIRQRMKKSNEGDYERERYKAATRMQWKLYFVTMTLLC